MTKTSHSKIYSTESGITGGGLFKTPPLHFTKEQLEWIENIQISKRLFLISATEFDDRYLYLHDDWRYRFSGNMLLDNWSGMPAPGILVRKVLHGLKKQKIAALSGTKFLVVLRGSHK